MNIKIKNIILKFLPVMIIAVLTYLGFSKDLSKVIAPEIQEIIEESISSEVESKTQALVTEVLDGDTFRLENNEKVRLIGIDTPEKGEKLSQEATELLEELILGKKITLEKDKTDKDKYDRSLRYVYMGELFINEEMVKRGLAKQITYYPDNAKEEILKEAETKAKEKKLGIWSEKTK